MGIGGAATFGGATRQLVFPTESSAASSSRSSISSSPPSTASSPRSSGDHLHLPEDGTGHGFASRLGTYLEGHDRDTYADSCTTSDSYDSAGEYSALDRRPSVPQIGVAGVSAQDALGAQHASWSGDDAASYYSSRMSSRVNSPAPSVIQQNDPWESYANTPFGYRSVSRNRSRNASGSTTPVLDKEHTGSDYYHSHHHQTSALLRKLGGTLTPDNSPVIGYKKRRPGWWSRRAESRRKNTGPSSAQPPALLGTPSTAKSRRDRSCLSTLGAGLLRQPWVPTQPLTILFAFLLFACFAATLTTFLVHVLSSDKQPLFWRQHCQEQRPFPHALADSLKPVSVFVGVFSVDAQTERRNAIRLTWAKQTKPIDPRTGRPTQEIQVKFVLGRPRKAWAQRIALEMETYNDIVVLDINENMNHGKTFEYFKWAAENATVPVYYSQTGALSNEVGIGFKKADYVVKADEDSFIMLNELERHLRITPRERTYWGYLVRNLFMAGEVYALSADLVKYVATYEPLRQYTIGKEDQRVAKWMRIHPEYSTIHWVSERCWIYDFPKAGTTYSHGFLFPDEVERIRAEGHRGISEEERLRRGGELAASYSTVSTWKKPYEVPAAGLSIEEQVEALVEGGGRWDQQSFRSDKGRGPQSVRLDSVIFDRQDPRLVDSRGAGYSHGVGLEPDKESTGVKPGVPDRSIQIPSARTTRFGKDLFRDPEGVDAVRLPENGNVKRSVIMEIDSDENDGSRIIEIHNAVRAPWESFEQRYNTTAFTPAEESSDDSSSASALISTSGSTDVDATETSTTPTRSGSHSESTVVEENLPTGAVKVPQHNYIMPPSSSDRFVPPPTHRYDSASLQIRSQRMLGRPHGGTVAVHYLKRHEWFYETALALLGRERTWDHGIEAPAFASTPAGMTQQEVFADYKVASIPSWQGQGTVQLVDAYWGGARMYGSPIIREDGYIVEGRPAESRREVVQPGVPNTATAGGRFGRTRTNPLFGLALEDGVEASIGGDVNQADAGPRPVEGILIQHAAAR